MRASTIVTLSMSPNRVLRRVAVRTYSGEPESRDLVRWLNENGGAELDRVTALLRDLRELVSRRHSRARQYEVNCRLWEYRLRPQLIERGGGLFVIWESA
jgi:hypothetical protein